MGSSPHPARDPAIDDWTVLYHVPRSQVWEGSRGGQRGNLHLHATSTLQIGRMVRHAGSYAKALCGKAGWYTRPVEWHDAGRCPECEARAVRHDIPWPPVPSPHPTERAER